jgi:type III secretory pathway component EscS
MKFPHWAIVLVWILEAIAVLALVGLVISRLQDDRFNSSMLPAAATYIVVGAVLASVIVWQRGKRA